MCSEAACVLRKGQSPRAGIEVDRRITTQKRTCSSVIAAASDGQGRCALMIELPSTSREACGGHDPTGHEWRSVYRAVQASSSLAYVRASWCGLCLERPEAILRAPIVVLARRRQCLF